MTVVGTGWINETECGMEKTAVRMIYADLKELRAEEKGLFKYPVKNFGRFDAPSKYACCAVALALKDARIAYEKDRRLSIGLVGTNEDGALAANHAYYEDFCACGKTLGRGNLFIYTLPSSPLAEVAIHFGLEGPLMYMAENKKDGDEAAACCARMLDDGMADYMLLVVYDNNGARCCVLDA